MKTFPKTRIEIVVEAPSLRRLTELLDRLPVTGYTVLTAVAGRGNQGGWSREGQVSSASGMAVVVCITDPDRVDDVLGPIYALVSRQIGIVTISDVHVIRKDHF